MSKLEVHAIEIVDEATPIGLPELLRCIHIERARLIEIVEAGAVTPVGSHIDHWIFVRRDVKRLQVVQRLMTDLDVNAPGAALILELLDERDALLKRLREISALTETLLESELFGHVRGAFTGATQNKKGLFEEANSGTIFLDEIGDLSPVIQVKLLRAIQEGEIKPVGSSETLKVDVRVVAATHRDLSEYVAQG